MMNKLSISSCMKGISLKEYEIELLGDSIIFKHKEIDYKNTIKYKTIRDITYNKQYLFIHYSDRGTETIRTYKRNQIKCF